MPHDLAVVGSGPGGSSAAIEAASLGLDVVVIDRGRRVGGSFVHTCALPSRVLREAALRAGRNDNGFDPASSVTALSEWIRRGVDRHLPPIEGMLEDAGVGVVRGCATLTSPNTLRIVDADGGETTLEANHTILAPGSQPRRPADVPFDGAVVCDSDSMLKMQSVPTTVTVLGGGFVGCELACTLAQLGAAVTVVDQRRRLLRMLDGEISTILYEQMDRLGIRFILGERIDAVRREQNGAGWHGVVELERSGSLRSDRVVVAMGREPNVASLDLEACEIERDDRGWIRVDGNFRTSCPSVSAIGDSIGPPMLGGASALQGRTAARVIANLDPSPPADLPITLFTIPELSMIGLTEEACRELGLDYAVGSARYAESARGQIRGDTEGVLKLVFRRDDGRLLGVHIVGAEASELIHLGAAILSRSGTIHDLAALPYSYPTFAQLYETAARRGLGLLAESRERASA